MSRIHEDIFKPGDLVTWRNDDMATVTGGRRKFGNVLTIKDVTFVPVSARSRCDILIRPEGGHLCGDCGRDI